ncbi:MAG TPA: Rrf2 family transcriptional regulator [Ruminococcaceae bacterium]|jgi:Rrf2 family protein|nr:Rrf2 family transcriptional regulator [Oscillospiraceae bacterium]HBG54909.1 Rrf2 family transcriptional regulator [Oscillospiraceae bacterium]HBQ46833.1 Rrf2 family transcriptional regulator [Oscillospiraceae bacterium]HBT90899.1 Rrf2 family transcriptional regulator [Oscillospiraceae bacterium]HCB91092.1 Rrf2 family transcriptional regulator [Oscillospiraceae bacterium]
MRISSKGRYGLAALIEIARNYASGTYITVVSLSEKLGISKIYLEQVFSLLKKAELVRAAKGAQGGYRLTRPPHEISAYEILKALEQPLFEKTEKSVAQKAGDVEWAMQSVVFSALDRAVAEALRRISLYDLVDEADKHRQTESFMYYI